MSANRPHIHPAHTPGPWVLSVDSTGKYISVHAQAARKIICPVRIEDKADAHLIAAAPELLEALRDVTEALEAAETDHDQRNGDHDAMPSPELDRAQLLLDRLDSNDAEPVNVIAGESNRDRPVTHAVRMLEALKKADAYFSMSPRERAVAEDRAYEATAGNVGYEEVVADAVREAVAKAEGRDA